MENSSGPVNNWSGTIDKGNGTRDFVKSILNVFLGTDKYPNIFDALKFWEYLYK